MPTIPGVLRAAAAACPDREAVGTPSERLTFATLLDRVRRFSAAAVAAGLSHGDRVAIVDRPLATVGQRKGGGADERGSAYVVRQVRDLREYQLQVGQVVAVPPGPPAR